MSFYSRYNGFGDSETTQALSAAHAAIAAKGIAATAAVQAADVAVDVATARLAAAKVQSARLNRVTSDLMQRGHAYFTGSGPALSADDEALFKTYGFTFPPDESNPGASDYDAGSEMLDRDRQNAADELEAATRDLPLVKSAAAAAKSELDKLTTAGLAAQKKYQDAVKAEQKAVVDIEKAKASGAIDARVALEAAKLKLLAQAGKTEGMSPMVIAALAVPVLGVLAYMATRKKAAVAGYRRRRSRK